MINANIIYICTLHVLSNAEASVNFKVAAVLAVPASTYTESMICCKETLQRGSINPCNGFKKLRQYLPCWPVRVPQSSGGVL